MDVQSTAQSTLFAVRDPVDCEWQTWSAEKGVDYVNTPYWLGFLLEPIQACLDLVDADMAGCP